MKKPTKRKCAVRGCKNMFIQFNSLHIACSVECSLVLVELKKKKQAKIQKTNDRIAKEALRPRSWYIKKAQESFNKFIRERDNNDVCISCQKRTGSKINAGHYLSCGARPELRYHPSNCHLQCEKCNSWLSSNAVLYRKNLINKVGLEMVDYLESFNIPQRLTVDELKEIAQHYKKEFKHLQSVK